MFPFSLLWHQSTVWNTVVSKDLVFLSVPHSVSQFASLRPETSRQACLLRKASGDCGRDEKFCGFLQEVKARLA